MTNVYKEFLLDHYRNPRNKGEVENADFKNKENNFLCGDTVEISGQMEEGKISHVMFQGKGCVVSQASASVLTDAVKGKTRYDIQAMNVNDVVSLLQVTLSPSRMRCAELSLYSLKKALGILQ